MSRSSTRAFPGRRRLRILVLLLVLWVPGATVPAPDLVDFPVAAESAEHDVPGTVPRPPDRPAQRAGVPERPALPPGPAPARPAVRPRPGPPRAPYPACLPRTVVLRC
ncbi:hypothetical protein ACH4NF_08060 [Streptomyces sp. NPDC017248]|uniref:hypothetical protein n=1 Tax=unclassified Streptomyces TaxID=2593676 RepID=UPI00379071A7